LVWGPAAVAVVVAVVAPFAPTIIVVARAAIAVVVNALSLASGLDDAPRISVGPKMALDR
jgi:hypothetical protein